MVFKHRRWWLSPTTDHGRVSLRSEEWIDWIHCHSMNDMLSQMFMTCFVNAHKLVVGWLLWYFYLVAWGVSSRKSIWTLFDSIGSHELLIIRWWECACAQNRKQPLQFPTSQVVDKALRHMWDVMRINTSDWTSNHVHHSKLWHEMCGE